MTCPSLSSVLQGSANSIATTADSRGAAAPRYAAVERFLAGFVAYGAIRCDATNAAPS
jgi:hypothetical protein